MTTYQHILVALDLSEHSLFVLKKAHELAQQNHAKLSAIHVIEPLVESSHLAFDGTISTDLLPVQDEIEASAKKKLSKLAASIDLAEENQLIQIGRPADTIHQLSKDLPCDLIVVGSHGRRGLSLLLGSTANAVLHGATCDVLAARVND
ncbi:MAG: universal stress protein A [Cycloclasticus pugetii]|mgnify:CR=1 FL=1|jgi:universal stress protein A|uniref:Universal stress protein n=2 Tax=Cycloclasticus TaxID=34067 RepID=S5TYT8_9GAMM|nr:MULTISPECIES: universal stress protein [Cycloclasticus]AFT66612.1 Universal stress protein UspA and related nucleotide-binding protein [Cycloclasticus sp. P1]AGS40345.1 Universal stress protein UspA-related nucleotide-binding protein [Cycloclasticus zancles 78-ME]ATI03816.1 universal stress protein [Cycloclasticus sp. PY97N]EPD14248.1 Universal stress protein UspA [Cycloclasticus pugetii]MBV1899697.1 universal stress protein [Cycloclasticus sp.]|tara:strand:+ start:208 stop:654 length:447 start_codon:yes stop_codon:yes gene_type:complete